MITFLFPYAQSYDFAVFIIESHMKHAVKLPDCAYDLIVHASYAASHLFDSVLTLLYNMAVLIG